jgi:hypothetical protein
MNSFEKTISTIKNKKRKRLPIWCGMRYSIGFSDVEGDFVGVPFNAPPSTPPSPNVAD